MNQENYSNPSVAPSIPPPSQQPLIPAGDTLLSAPALFQLAWQEYKSRWKLYAGLAVALSVVRFAWGLFFQIMPGGFIRSAAAVILYLVLAGIGVLTTVAIISVADDRSRNLTFAGAYRFAFQKFLAVWWVSVLIGVISAGIIFIFIVPLIIAGTLLHPAFYPLAIFGGVAMAIVGVWFSMSIYVATLEDIRGMNALLKSYFYVKGKMSAVFWRFIVLGAIIILISLPAIILSYFVEAASILSPLVLLISVSLVVVLEPLAVIYMYRLYQNLKELKGGSPLEPKRNTKILFLALAVVGILLMIGAIFAVGLRSKKNGAPAGEKPSWWRSSVSPPLGGGESLRENRDAKRVADLYSLHSAIVFYLIEAQNPDLAIGNRCSDEQEKTIFVSLESVKDLPPPPAGWRWHVSPTPKNVDGTGWIPIDFTKLEGGSPISELPLDPINRADLPRGKRLFYAYVCRAGNLTFALNANMESEFYAKDGSGDVESGDGGKWPYAYETGTAPEKLSPGETSDIYYLSE